MKLISNRTELRWALEDMGDAGRPILQYLQGFFEYSDAFARLAEHTVTRLAAAEHLCADIDIDALPGGVQDTIIEVGNTVHDVKEDWKYMVEDYEQC